MLLKFYILFNVKICKNNLFIEVKIEEFIKILSSKNIIEKSIPVDVITIHKTNHISRNNYIVVKSSDDDHDDHYHIEFDAFLSWSVLNNGGDGWITQNYEEIEDIEIEIEIHNIENYNYGDQILITNVNCIHIVESWVESLITLE